MANFESKRDPWQLSPKATQLHRSLLESFNEQDRARFTDILTKYQQNKNIQRLVESLRQICNTPQQRDEIYPLLRTFVPHKHRERFDYECSRPKSAYGRHYAATYSRKQSPRYDYYTTRSLPSDTRNRQSGSSLGFGRKTPRGYNPHTTPKPARDRKESNARVVVLEREVEGESFGFCIRGGSEYNIGLFVSSVDGCSVAHNAGVCLGDQILEVNRVDFTNISHHEAVKVIQQAPMLHILVRSVGKIPGSFNSTSSYRWTDPRGNEVSPPAEYARENLMNGNKSEMRLLGGDDERKVNLFVADGAEIGLKIRGGIEHGLGIFIASVERNSGADRAGIQVGDQILDVNGKSFLNISHEEAVRVLKSSQQLVIMLKDVGILPHGKRVYDETRWIRDSGSKSTSRPSSSSSSDGKSRSMKKTPSFHEPMGSSQLTHHSVLDHSEEILEMKARQLLPTDDLHAFAFYLNEYRATRLSLASFLTVLSDLLNTPEKGSLFQEIRSAILPRDLMKFDEWIEKTVCARLQANDISDSKQTRHDGLSLYSYKSSDSSTNSWLGLFENGDEQRTKTNIKFRQKHDALPHPPKDFLEDSLVSSSRTPDVDSTQRNASFDDFPPPPVFDLSTERTPGNTERFETNNNSLTKPTSLINSSKKFSPLNKKSAEKFAGSKLTSTHTVQTGQLRHRQDNSHTSSMPNYPTGEKSDNVRETPGERKGNLATTVEHMGMNSSMYPPEDSTCDDDGLYTSVDYKGFNRTSRDFSNDMDKIAMQNGDGSEDGLYTSMNDTNRKHRIHGHGSRTIMDNVQKTVLSDEDVEDGLHTSIDHENVNVVRNGGSQPKKVSQTIGVLKNGLDDLPIYTAVDKSKILPKDTKNNFLDESEFEIPPPIPDRNFEESLQSPNNCYSEPNSHDFTKSTNTNIVKKDNFLSSETGRIVANINGRNEIATNAAVETDIASFPERLQKFSGKMSVERSGGDADARKLKKGKKTKSRTNVFQKEEHVDYSQPFVVELTKHSSNLGLSVAGGTDTESKEIRIKSIKDEDTIAGSCPLLQPGQIILGVDEKSLQNVTSGIAAMAIRQAFHSNKTVLKLILQNDS